MRPHWAPACDQPGSLDDRQPFLWRARRCQAGLSRLPRRLIISASRPPSANAHHGAASARLRSSRTPLVQHVIGLTGAQPIKKSFSRVLITHGEPSEPVLRDLRVQTVLGFVACPGIATRPKRRSPTRAHTSRASSRSPAASPSTAVGLAALEIAPRPNAPRSDGQRGLPLRILPSARNGAFGAEMSLVPSGSAAHVVCPSG